MQKKFVGFFLGIAAFLAILIFTDLEPGKPEVTATLAVAALMAIWWVSETIPLAVTALVPMVLFPVLGVLDGKAVSEVYINHIIFVFVGGFMMALAMEKWNLHRRIAMKLLVVIGVSPGRILIGFMITSAFLSMWISNTATTMMMIPILMSIVSSLEESLSGKSLTRYATGLFLAVAYSSSIGGMSTLVGSPTNLVCPKILTLLYPGAPDISFTSWMVFALPVSVVMLVAVWLLIHLMFKPREKWQGVDRDHFKKSYLQLGKASREERIVFVLFLTLALLWITRAGISTGRFTLPGWSQLFKTRLSSTTEPWPCLSPWCCFCFRPPTTKGSGSWTGKRPSAFPGTLYSCLEGVLPWPLGSSLPDWPSGSGSSLHGPGDQSLPDPAGRGGPDVLSD
jgi:sodium-dependent dicarboxylate transporter 2/3/5